MHWWMQIALFNAVSASLLALLVAVVARRIQRPAVVHVLWLLVLLELISPPVIEIDALPAWDRVQWGVAFVTGQSGAAEAERAQHSAATARVAAAGNLQSVEHPGDPGQPVIREHSDGSWTLSAAAGALGRWAVHLLPFLLGAGTVLILGLSVVQLARFRHRLRHAAAAPPALQSRAARLARSFGMGREPRIRIVSGQIPPSLWPGPGACEILLPADLLPHLSDAECDAILAHELAHVRRRDHWLRPIELLVVALYWWHPVVWVARRNLRIAEEQSCDELVVQHLQSRRRVYADGLLKTVEFLAHTDLAFPLLATGATGTARLKERVTMILRKKAPTPMSPALRPVLAGAMLLVLLVSPAWVHKARSADGEINPEREHQQKMLAIDEQEVQLQREMQRLEQERQDVRMKIEEGMLQQQLEEMRQQMAALEKDGLHSEVEELRHKIASLQLEAGLRRKEIQSDQVFSQKRMQLEYQLQDLSLKIQHAELEGDPERAAELQQRSFELEQALRQLQLEAMQSELDRSRERFEFEKKQLENMQP